MAEKELKTGALRGGGPEPGYRWNVEYLTLAEAEARRILKDDCQYEHVIDQVRELARQDDPTHPATLRVDAVQSIHELKEKGGPLGKINLRVFFWVDRQRRTIVLLGHYKKEAEGSTPPAVVRTMERRKRKYVNGDYGTAE